MQAFIDLLRDFSLVFLPLLVAMDPLAIVPFLVSFLSSIPSERRRRLTHTALLSGLVIGLIFLGLGRVIFFVLGIEVPDFLIAGGIVLLVISLRDLLSTTEQTPTAPNELIAVVPIGTPLLIGPATISMLILLSGIFDTRLVIAAFLANMLVAWFVFTQAQRIMRFLGLGGLQAFSKVVYLLLAAIAVQLIRQGITEILQQPR